MARTTRNTFCLSQFPSPDTQSREFWEGPLADLKKNQKICMEKMIAYYDQSREGIATDSPGGGGRILWRHGEAPCALDGLPSSLGGRGAHSYVEWLSHGQDLQVLRSQGLHRRAAVRKEKVLEVAQATVQGAYDDVPSSSWCRRSHQCLGTRLG